VFSGADLAALKTEIEMIDSRKGEHHE
jgi:hypothetical protein